MKNAVVQVVVKEEPPFDCDGDCYDPDITNTVKIRVEQQKTTCIAMEEADEDEFDEAAFRADFIIVDERKDLITVQANELETEEGRKFLAQLPFLAAQAETTYTTQPQILKSRELSKDTKAAAPSAPPAPFHCVVCPLSFNTTWERARHISLHALNRYFCKEHCGRQFPSIQACEKHEFNAHRLPNGITCSVCSYKPLSAADYVQHNQVHRHDKCCVCGICRGGFAHKNDLAAHWRMSPHTCGRLLNYELLATKKTNAVSATCDGNNTGVSKESPKAAIVLPVEVVDIKSEPNEEDSEMVLNEYSDYDTLIPEVAIKNELTSCSVSKKLPILDLNKRNKLMRIKTNDGISSKLVNNIPNRGAKGVRTSSKFAGESQMTAKKQANTSGIIQIKLPLQLQNQILQNSKFVKLSLKQSRPDVAPAPNVIQSKVVVLDNAEISPYEVAEETLGETEQRKLLLTNNAIKIINNLPQSQQKIQDLKQQIQAVEHIQTKKLVQEPKQEIVLPDTENEKPGTPKKPRRNDVDAGADGFTKQRSRKELPPASFFLSLVGKNADDVDAAKRKYPGYRFSWKCPRCGRQYEKKNALCSHMMSKHHMTSEDFIDLLVEITPCKKPMHPCGECGKKFYSVSALNCHLSIHTGELPFSCNFCDKRFRTRGQVKVHHRVHTGEKPFFCEVCQQSFTHRETLISHISRHIGMKRYKCYACNRQFSCISGLKTHRRARPDSCGKAKLNSRAIGPRVRIVRGNLFFEPQPEINPYLRSENPEEPITSN